MTSPPDTPLRRVCVFCGSNRGRDPVYRETAARVGELLARKQVTIVYGGGNVGLMGVLADAALAAGGTVIGVIPRSLVDRELAHHGVTELRVVDSMHERKALMTELSDAFMTLPGAIGSMDETCEVLTWAQLGIHRKAIGILNVAGYYDALLALLDRFVADGFMRAEHRDLLLVRDDPAELLDALSGAKPVQVVKWLDLDES